jgi:hypothetical protein
MGAWKHRILGQQDSVSFYRSRSRRVLLIYFQTAVRTFIGKRMTWLQRSEILHHTKDMLIDYSNPINDYHGFTRRMHRITLAGDKPQ